MQTTNKFLLALNFPLAIMESMKKVALIPILFILAIGFALSQTKSLPQESRQTSVSPTPDIRKSTQAIEKFSEGNARNIEFLGEHDDPTWNGTVQAFKDENGTDYRVDKVTSNVIFFLSENDKGKIGTSKNLVSSSQAEKIGREFAKRNMTDYINFSAKAKYTFIQETAEKMNGQYVLNWEGKKPGSMMDEAQPTFHSVVVLDKYGNVISFQNEYITEELGR